MKNRMGTKHYFEVHLDWLKAREGMISMNSPARNIYVNTSQEFSTESHYWTPEHLFLSSLSSAYMTTCLSNAQTIGFEMIDFNCHAVGLVEVVDGHYRFTKIDLFPKIFVKNRREIKKAELAMEKTNNDCLVINSLVTAVYYHCEVLPGPEMTVDKAGKRLESLTV